MPPHDCEYAEDIGTIKANTTTLLMRDRERGKTIDSHIEESRQYRKMVDQHEEFIGSLKDELRDIKIWVRNGVITIVIALLGVAVVYGEMRYKLERCIGHVNKAEAYASETRK